MDGKVIISQLLESFKINCEIFFVTLVLALPLGLMKSKDGEKVSKGAKLLGGFKPIRFLVQAFVWIIRGTPLMLQIIVIFYGPGLLWSGKALPRVTATIVAFVINYACYFSEIFRGGIQSVPKGQAEAGQVLGMTRSQVFFKVTLLQVVKRVLPPMGNEFMTLIKDTALANVIANKEIIMMAKEFATKGLIWPLFSTALFFLVFCGVLTILFGWLEKKLDYFKV